MNGLSLYPAGFPVKFIRFDHYAIWFYFLCAVFCFLTVGKNRIALLLAAVAGAGCVINFVLCGYLPHLIPLSWFAVFFFVSWCIGMKKSIFRREALAARLVAGVVAISLVAM